MAKRVLIVGVVLGASLFVVGAGSVLGVVLGTRALVVSAAAVKPGVAMNIAPGNLAVTQVVVAIAPHGG